MVLLAGWRSRDRDLAVVKILQSSRDQLDIVSGVMSLSWGWGECDRSSKY
ncbi:hypothetical protein [Kamptonema sp. UHCC 0994]|nr:hypothetical protein [Kamptonema sp. UHCC 0994]MDF0556802.1 hypothetical protein [Kamptonema sp. UHCC 0994]